MKNKTVLTVIFLLGVSGINLLLGNTLQHQTVGAAEVLGGPVFLAGENVAMVGNGAGGDMGFDMGPAIAYDAALISTGQSTFEVIKQSLEDIVKRFSLPARGINWGKEHAHNAVDIAARCGSPVFPAAPGTVVGVRVGWNGGYGNYIDIDNENGIITRYAHNQKNLVVVGEIVGVGDTIAYVGSTGDSTGCHVHFEVRGSADAPNPFVKH